MVNQFSRTELLFGSEAMKKLANCRVIIFGIGGVGGYVAEALVRGGVGAIDIVDNDTVALTNLNRQILALHSTIGKLKVEVLKERLLDINPDLKINCLNVFYTPETKHLFKFSKYDYVVDAIDTVVGKLSLIEEAKRNNVQIICAMGAGNKTDATKFEVSDISKTSVCPLARVIRQELRKRKIKDVKVVYSKEEPLKPNISDYSEQIHKKNIPASNSFCPPVMGLIMAGEVIKDLIKGGK